jgi:hypothetical protein
MVRNEALADIADTRTPSKELVLELGGEDRESEGREGAQKDGGEGQEQAGKDPEREGQEGALEDEGEGQDFAGADMADSGSDDMVQQVRSININ